MVENYFGRLGNLWCIICFVFKWNQKMYDKKLKFSPGMPKMQVALHQLHKFGWRF